MTDFKIYSDNLVINNNNNNIVISFNLEDFVSIYEDYFIKLIWNPLYSQPQFKLKYNVGNYIRGGYEILNLAGRSISSFQFENDNNSEYYFSRNSEVLVNNDYKFINNWNRANLWLSSLFDIYFPYYDIKINANSNNGIIIINKYNLY